MRSRRHCSNLASIQTNNTWDCDDVTVVTVHSQYNGFKRERQYDIDACMHASGYFGVKLPDFQLL